MAGQQVLAHRVAHQRGEAVESPPHVDRVA